MVALRLDGRGTRRRSSGIAVWDEARALTSRVVDERRETSRRSVRSGRYGGIGRTPVGQEWKRLGENVLERAGVQKSLNFDRDWGERVLSVR